MKPVVYVETSIPSFYYEVRTDADMVARRQWTRRWWAGAQDETELVTSAAVLEELEAGDYPSRGASLDLMATLPPLAVDVPVRDIVETYVSHHVMPKDRKGDALHLALASFHRCDFLVTWNCQQVRPYSPGEHVARCPRAVARDAARATGGERR